MRDPGGGRPGGLGRAGIVAGIVAVVALHLALVMPNHLDRITPAGLARLSVELIAILALLALARGRWRAPVEWAATVFVSLALVLKIADAGAFMAFARPFNPVLDAHLLSSAMDLVGGAVGRAGALAAAAGAVLAVVAVVVAVRLAVTAAGRLARAIPFRGMATSVGLAAVAWTGLGFAGAGLSPRLPLASAQSLDAVVVHVRETARSLGDLHRFREEAAVDPWASVPPERLLTALRGRDVVVAFVESYGRTVIDDPRYAGPVRALLDDAGGRLAASGVGVRSAWLTSPTVGGMSWLAHATALSGLWVDNQRRHDSLMTSDRMTLNRAFGEAGWRTVGLMPAITMAWPEGAFYGYDALYPAADLGYRGKPFNWVTMPDQYVWSALRDLELDRADRPPVMAEIALISSHAPWTPVPRMIPWADVGDGRVFDAMATEGDPPDVVWKDSDRVRRQYRETIEYALSVIASYATTFDLSRTVLVVLGDHQPAPLVTGEGAGRDVPIHVITADAAVLDAIAARGFTDGFRPGPEAPVLRMDRLRDLLLETFSPDAEP
jgi:hypothetical protein